MNNKEKWLREMYEREREFCDLLILRSGLKSYLFIMQFTVK